MLIRHADNIVLRRNGERLRQPNRSKREEERFNYSSENGRSTQQRTMRWSAYTRALFDSSEMPKILEAAANRLRANAAAAPGPRPDVPSPRSPDGDRGFEPRIVTGNT